MHRCLELAALGAGRVAPNPMVGAVLVNGARIIGEGYHERYGGPHAEVNCINSVMEADKHLIASSTIYVSLEPCAHFGKTPPCADLIIDHRIPNCKIGCRDPFEAVNGKGIDKLLAAGVHVETGILEKDCQEINKRFFTFHLQQRPYVILKWAQTADHFIGLQSKQEAPPAGFPPGINSPGKRLLISNAYTNRLVHKWRSEEAAIMVGTNTALFDNPGLTNRLWTGDSPVRVVIDMDLRLPPALQLFSDGGRTIVFNSHKTELKNACYYYLIRKEEAFIPQILAALYELRIESVLVEGGTKLLQSFIDENAWDEARVITNTMLTLLPEDDIFFYPAPIMKHFMNDLSFRVSDDQVNFYKPVAL